MFVVKAKNAGGGIPHEWSTFVGRQVERADLHRLLERERLVTLVGAGGCGKTRLAFEVARDRALQGDTRSIAVEFAAVMDEALVADTIRAALGLGEQPVRDPVDVIVSGIGDESILLVLDNCEHLLAAVRVVATAILRASESVRVLATSREPLGVANEIVFRLPSLQVPDCVNLFRERALRVQGFQVTLSDDAELVQQIAQRLEGMPLAIELAASMTRTLSVGEIAESIDTDFHLLGVRAAGRLPRHETLTASIDWSYRLLTELERATLRALSVFSGGFTMAAAERVVGSPVLSSLVRLVDASLVQVHVSVDTSRYTMLGTIREFARDRAVELGEQKQLRLRHLDWMCALVAQAAVELDGGPQLEWLDRLGLELNNLRIAIAFALEAHRAIDAITLTAGCGLFWKLRSHLAEGREALSCALALVADDAPRHLAGEWASADLTYWSGERREAQTLAEELVEAAREFGDRWTEARALWTIANTSIQDDLTQAREFADQAAELARQHNDVWLLGVALPLVGLTWRWSDRHDLARPYFDETLSLASARGIPQHEAWGWVGLQPAATCRGDFDESDRCYERGMQAAGSLRDPASTAHLAEARAESLERRGRRAEARLVLTESLDRLSEAGIPDFAPFLYYRLVRSSVGDDPATLAYAVNALDGIADPNLAVRVYTVFAHAWVYLANGEVDATLTTTDEAVGYSGESPWVLSEQLCVRGLAVLATDAQLAASSFDEALSIAQNYGFLPVVADALDGIAAVMVRRESDGEAARLFGAARRLRADIGAARLAPAATIVLPYENTLRERIGSEYETRSGEGEMMALSEAIADARKNRGRRNRPTSGWDGLTPTERRVAELAAQGLTNAQIATELFVSAGTVKTHLAHAYAKLGVANRAALAANFARHT